MKKLIMSAIAITSLLSAGIAQTGPDAKNETAKTKTAGSSTQLLASNTRPVRKEMPAPLQDTSHKSKKAHKDKPKRDDMKKDSTTKKTKH